MHEHPLILISLTLAAIATATAAAIATRVQVLPEVIDLTLIPTGSGLGSLTLVTYGATRRFEPERIGRLSLAGNARRRRRHHGHHRDRPPSRCTLLRRCGVRSALL